MVTGSVNNSDNPFVKNDLYFIDVIASGDRGTFYALRKISNHLALMLGIFFSILSYYLVGFQSPRSLKAYRKIFFLGVFVDMSLVFVNYLIQPRIRQFGGLIMVTFTGPASWLGYQSYCTLNILQLIGPSIMAATLPVQYYVRYALLKNFVSFLAFTSKHLYCPADRSFDIDCSPLWFVEAPIPQLLLAKSKSPENLLHQLTDFVLFLSYYSISMYLLHITRKELDKDLLEYDNRVRIVQRQVERALFVRATLLLIVTSVPRLFASITPFTNLFNGYSGEIQMLLVFWLPPISLFCTIVSIRYYRNYCLQLFCFYTPPQNVTGPIVFTNMQSGSLTRADM